MFRIKTDIRKYECDSSEKVEKLIRGWVVRPNDLIYDDAGGATWSPIGTHPMFEPMFAALDKEKKEEAPEAPRGSEPSVRVEEITMMTDRTASLLGFEYEDDQDADARSTLEERGGEDSNTSDLKPAMPPRGDLPEELFLTNELDIPRHIHDLIGRRLDELGQALKQPVDTDTRQTTPNEGIRDTNEPHGARSTLEFDVEDIIAYDAKRKAQLDKIREAQALHVPGKEEVEGVVDDPLHEASDQAEDSGEEKYEDEDDTLDMIEGVDMSSLVSDLDEVDRFDETTPAHQEILQGSNVVSDGYGLPLPFPVGPTDDDIAAGVRHATASIARKDAHFPYPRPKRSGVVYMCVFLEDRDALVSARDGAGEDLTTDEFTLDELREVGRKAQSSHPTATRRVQAVVGTAPSQASPTSRDSGATSSVPDRLSVVLVAMFVVFVLLVGMLVVVAR
ncbi:MAG: hypothetical protein AAGI01_07580 [Myxococcota bacterium]